MRMPVADLYAVLGVSPAATMAELRRAYRLLALQHHPDRAGPASAHRFADIAEAYRMLSDPTARTAYDAHRFQYAAARAQTPDDLRGDDRGWNFASANWSASWRRAVVDLLSRVSGPLDMLVANGVAAVAGDGTLELRLSAAEAASGGTAGVTMGLRVSCPTRGGDARRGGGGGGAGRKGRGHDGAAGVLPALRRDRARGRRLVPPLRVCRRDHRGREGPHPDPARRSPRRRDHRHL